MRSDDERRAATGAATLGWCAAAAAVLVWAGWIVFTRAAVAETAGGGAPQPTPWDLALLRFVAPAVLLAPFWLDPRAGLFESLAPRRLGWPILIGLQLWGAPFVVFGATGLATGDAALFAALVPGAMPLWAALIAVVAVGARPRGAARAGLGLLAVGVALALASRGVDAAPAISAVAWMTAAAACWAAFTVAFSASGLGAAHAAGLVGAQATLIAAVGCVVFGSSLLEMSWSAVAWHAGTQGLLTGVFAILAFGVAVQRLGRASAAAASALVPPTAAAMAWAALGEAPSTVAWIGLGCASLGVALVASGQKAAAR